MRPVLVPTNDDPDHGEVEQCPGCGSVVFCWRLIPMTSDYPDGMCDACRPAPVSIIPRHVLEGGPGIGFTC